MTKTSTVPERSGSRVASHRNTDMRRGDEDEEDDLAVILVDKIMDDEN